MKTINIFSSIKVKIFIIVFIIFSTVISFAQGFNSIANLTSTTVSAITGEKPQSKVWSNAGKWWMVMPNSTGTHVFRLDGTTWTSILDIDASTTSYADCKVVGNVTHILLYKGTASSLVSVEYTSNTYQLWTTRPSTVAITLDGGVETATIDLDGTGRMWLASAGTSDINVRWSDAPYSTWSSPITIGTGVTDDDICAITAFSGKIGVLWSNQNTQRFGFKFHVDGAAAGTWSADEIPASQSAVIGTGMADDHLNFAVASDGTIYAAVKTSFNDFGSGLPQIALLIRRPAGTWDNLYEVSTTGTRGIVILNETAGKVKVIYTASDAGGNILYKESATSAISFGPVTTLISGGTFNNATSTKQNYSGDIVVIASGGSSLVGILGTDIEMSNLVAHWKMDETTGSTLDDATSNNNDATTVNSPVFVTGVQGNALQLNGTTQNATAPNSPTLDINGAGTLSGITLAAWINPANSTATTQNIIKKANTSGISDGYELSLASAASTWPQKVFFRLNQFTSGDGFRVNSTTLYPLNGSAWMHIAATFDGTKMKLYINGIQEGGDLPGPAGGIVSNTLGVGIGAQPDGSSKFMGLIDDARIYNKALTAAEILALVATGPPAPALINPADGSTGIALSPTLSWNASATATSYRAQVSTVSNFATTVFDQSSIATTSVAVTPALLNNTVYYWRVNATNTNGTSVWSSFRTFTTIALIPPIEDNGSGYALDFDGEISSTTGDYVNCGNASSLNISQSLTLEAWIKPTERKTHSIVKKFASGAGFELFLEGPSPYRVSIRLNGTSNTYRVNSTTSYPIDGTWMHVAGTYDFSTNTIKLFINGIQEGGNLTGPGSIGTTINPLMIGADLTDFATKGFKGMIDEVRVWNIVRSDADIKANMTKKLIGTESGLVGYWRFDETSGTLMNDETANNNDGTMINMDPATDHIWSGAALGDASASDYVAAGGYTATITHPDGDAITATTTSGSITGIQVYRANDNAIRTGSTGLASYTLDPLRFWGVRALGTATPTYTLVYNYTGNPAVSTEIGLKLVKRNSISVSAWTDALATQDINANTLTVTGATGTEYALAIPALIAPLPVNIITFKAEVENREKVKITWTTTFERDNSHYEIQRSGDAINYTTIGTTQGVNNSNSLQDYSFYDNLPLKGVFFYRLKQVDIDNRFSFSKVERIKLSNTDSKLEIFPNPISGNSFTIKLLNEVRGNVDIRIFDMKGSIQPHHQHTISNNIMINHHLAPGTYTIIITTNEMSEAKKIIVH
ncbi:MAG: LamG-like jellyroll fold domain-containing protein [Chitinophagaceae bacterium]